MLQNGIVFNNHKIFHALVLKIVILGGQVSWTELVYPLGCNERYSVCTPHFEFIYLYPLGPIDNGTSTLWETLNYYYCC